MSSTDLQTLRRWTTLYLFHWAVFQPTVSSWRLFCCLCTELHWLEVAIQWVKELHQVTVLPFFPTDVTLARPAVHLSFLQLVPRTKQQEGNEKRLITIDHDYVIPRSSTVCNINTAWQVSLKIGFQVDTMRYLPFFLLQFSISSVL